MRRIQTRGACRSRVEAEVEDNDRAILIITGHLAFDCAPPPERGSHHQSIWLRLSLPRIPLYHAPSRNAST